MTLINAIELLIAIVGLITAAAVVWANGIADEPPATEDEKRQWPRG